VSKCDLGQLFLFVARDVTTLRLHRARG
jgi:hypothetical protein